MTARAHKNVWCPVYRGSCGRAYRGYPSSNVIALWGMEGAGLLVLPWV